MSTELHTLSGAFAVDALTPEEAAAFRTHLEECAVCRQEVRELRAAAAQMGEAEAVVPPAHLKARVLAAADKTPQKPPRVTRPDFEAPPKARGRRWVPRALGAAAAAVVLVAGAVVGINQLQGDDEQAPPLAAGVTQVFTASDAHSIEVETSHGPLRVATSQSEKEMAVDTRDLVPLDAEHVYQLWAVTPDGTASAGLLEDPDAGAHMEMPGKGVQVAITVEPAGGSEQPTSDPIAQVDPAAV